MESQYNEATLEILQNDMSEVSRLFLILINKAPRAGIMSISEAWDIGCDFLDTPVLSAIELTGVIEGQHVNDPTMSKQGCERINKLASAFVASFMTDHLRTLVLETSSRHKQPADFEKHLVESSTFIQFVLEFRRQIRLKGVTTGDQHFDEVFFTHLYKIFTLEHAQLLIDRKEVCV